MALEHVRLADPQQLDDTAAAIYANPASTKTYIKLLWLYNTNATPETVTIYYVPDSAGSLGTAGDQRNNQEAGRIATVRGVCSGTIKRPSVLAAE